MKNILIVIALLLVLSSCESKMKKPIISDDIASPSYKRTQEVSQRVWFAPYIDEDGNQHEASFVNVVIKKSKWQVDNETDN